MEIKVMHRGRIHRYALSAVMRYAESQGVAPVSEADRWGIITTTAACFADKKGLGSFYMGANGLKTFWARFNCVAGGSFQVKIEEE